MKAALHNGLVLAQDDWDHMDWDNGWWIVMMIGMLLFWALLVVGIVWLVRSRAGGGNGPGSAPRDEGAAPLEILERRLAEGSISVEEYEERRRVLTGPAGSASGEAGG